MQTMLSAGAASHGDGLEVGRCMPMGHSGCQGRKGTWGHWVRLGWGGGTCECQTVVKRGMAPAHSSAARVHQGKCENGGARMARTVPVRHTAGHRRPGRQAVPTQSSWEDGTKRGLCGRVCACSLCGPQDGVAPRLLRRKTSITLI